jgi:hypothetical protein
MSEVASPPPKGIGGWLIFVVIGLVISPFRIIYFMTLNHWPVFRDGLWQELTTPRTEIYHSLWAPLIVFEVLGNFAAIAMALTTLAFLIRRSRHTPSLAIAWFGWMAALVVVDYFAADLIPAVAAQSDPDSTKELVRSLLSAAIWIPYFWYPSE